MPGLSAFLSRDRRAAAVLAVAIAAGSVAGSAAYAPSPEAIADLPPAETELVRFEVHAGRLRSLATSLRRSTDACLSAQGRMLEFVSSAGVQPAYDAIEARSRSALAERGADRDLAEAREILGHGHLTVGQERELARHVAFRDACLDWASRSVSTLAGYLGTGAQADLARARGMAARDAGTVEAIRQGGIPEDAESIRGTETYGPRP